jgi:hypothetical protein
VLFLSVSLLAGCYERVVRAEGPMSSNVDVYEPNLKESEDPSMRAFEEALFGPQETTKSAGRSRSR